MRRGGRVGKSGVSPARGAVPQVAGRCGSSETSSRVRHGCVCDVKLALGACATLAEEAAHPALLRFQSAHAAREWRRRHAKILPAHLQPAPYAFDWAALLPRVSRPIPARAAPATAAAEYTNFTVGRRQVQVDLDGAARMLAEEAIARSTLGSWAYAARLTDPRSEVARLYEQWNAQHDQQFMPPLLPEDPRLSLIHKGLSDLAAGRWAAQSGRTRTHRALLALFLSSQIAYSGMVKLMGSDCGLLEVRDSESERQLAERVQELLVFRQQQRSRRRLQPLPYQRKGGRKRKKAGAEPSTHDLEFAQAVRGICSLSALALESVHQAVVANKGAARAAVACSARAARARQAQGRAVRWRRHHDGNAAGDEGHPLGRRGAAQPAAVHRPLRVWARVALGALCARARGGVAAAERTRAEGGRRDCQAVRGVRFGRVGRAAGSPPGGWPLRAVHCRGAPRVRPHG